MGLFQGGIKGGWVSNYKISDIKAESFFGSFFRLLSVNINMGFPSVYQEYICFN
jgi:hypothetical protein